jgi:serine/threonine protein kinase
LAWQGSEERELAVGDTLGAYRLEAVLGEGGMGIVFRAKQAGDGAEVALKVLKLDLTGDETYERRFLHEARAAAVVRHENLVSILDAGEVDGRHYIAADYISGSTLEDRIRIRGPLGADAIVTLAREVAAGVEALHEHGIVHRDIKASNVLLTADGKAMLTDFGLAKSPAYTVLTRPGQVMGTLEYLAPELIRGEPATTATDLYALGCVIFECAAGKTPFGDRSLFQIGIAHLDEEPSDPGAGREGWPPALSAAVLEALHKDAGLRPAGTMAYADLLERAAARA